MGLTKVLSVANDNDNSILYIINLKLKKIIFKLKYVKIIDMHYIESYNRLVIAQPFKVDIIKLNSNLK